MTLNGHQYAHVCNQALDATRNGLIDSSLKNPALKYRVLKSRGLYLVDVEPKTTFELLVRQKKTFTFLATDEAMGAELSKAYETLGVTGDETGEEIRTRYRELVLEDHPDKNPGNPEAIEDFHNVKDAYQLVVVSEQRGNGGRRATSSSGNPRELRTKYSPSDLQKRLLNSYRAARTSIQEQGVNTLYLTLGMLTWYQADSSQQPLKAPLLLIPVELRRANVAAAFQLVYADGEPEENLSLREKLKTDFGIELPALDIEDLDVDDYLTKVKEQLERRPKWKVDTDTATIGFYSFSKFRMYRDLDAAAWPEGKKPCHHTVLKKLLTEEVFEDSGASIFGDALTDDYFKPEHNYLVMDADSSQIQAVVEANAGKNLVIQGPPGTGKSQTITNLIAEAVGQGKTVLFVAEKMAALEVVKRNLDNIGLGDMCLELHSHKANKKSLLEDLQRTLELATPQHKDANFARLHLLDGQRFKLNAYAKAVNTPIHNSDITPYEAYGNLLKLQDTASDTKDFPSFNLKRLEDWDRQTFERKRSLVEQLQAWCMTNGLPLAHPFWGSGLKARLPDTQEVIRKSCDKTLEATSKLEQLALELAQTLKTPPPRNREELLEARNLALWALDAPELKGVALDAPWLERCSELNGLLEEGIELVRKRRTYQSILISRAWDQDIETCRRDLAQLGHIWWRGFSGKYRQANRQVNELFKDRPPKKLSDKLAVLEAIQVSQEAGQKLTQGDEIGKQFFGSQWQGENSRWEDLFSLLEWMVKLHQELSEAQLPDYALEVLTHARDLDQASVEALERELSEHDALWKSLLEMLKFDEETGFKTQALSTLSFREQKEILNNWHTKTDQLQAIVSLNHLLDELQEAGLWSVFETVRSWETAPGTEHLASTFDKTWYQALLDAAFVEHPELSGFEGATHGSLVETFRELDKLTLSHNRAKVISKHRDRLPRDSHVNGLSILKHEMAKKKKHLSIRELMKRAGDAIQRIKPVFMMSPMSIAQFLPPSTIDFALVIFDEASQVRPADAFGAILRGKQIIVVGDSKQLPPTSFFDKLGADDGEDDNGDSVGTVKDLESILDVFETRGILPKSLRWHYRSRHESLIAVSNLLFYNNKLLVFPSPSADSMGLVLNHHPETAYDAGRSKTNQKEARIVAEAVMDHARNYPDRSLGVVAFSLAQMTAIEDQLERLRHEDPSLEETFFNRQSEEPFFVKNLESVQGDERDTIFISVGYGRQENGSLSMNFGPVNLDGGWRRLNVLFTRARRRCEIFSNLTASDINLGSSANQGRKALKAFLNYAETGKLDVDASLSEEFGSPFEEAVSAKLSGLGYEAHPQVGVAGYRIDLGIVNADRPGAYLLGIECDGATYHSARSARDRDRLRQTVLEKRGWTIHRIWSTDWFHNPARELERVVEAIERAKVTAARVEGREASPLRRIQEFSVRQDEHGSEAIRTPDSEHSTVLNSHETGDDQVSDLPVYEVQEISFSKIALTSDSNLNPSPSTVPDTHAPPAFSSVEGSSISLDEWRELARWARRNDKFTRNDREFMSRIEHMLEDKYELNKSDLQRTQQTLVEAKSMGFKHVR